MAIEDQGAFEKWQQRKPDAEFAAGALSTALGEPEGDPAAVLDAYLFAKRTLAQSMQFLLRSQLPEASRAAFHDVQARIREELHSRFSDRVPEQYLRVPYATTANEELFAVLHHAMGSPVSADRLRTANADDVHTERRIRELRELGLDISVETVDGDRCYVLGSLNLDGARMRELVLKAIRKSRALSDTEQEEMIAQLP